MTKVAGARLGYNMRYVFAVLLAVIPALAGAQSYTGTTWRLLAIDGTLVEARSTLRIDVDNVLAGAAPCNRWQAMNGQPLPALQLGAIRSTRMACDQMAAETVFFNALALMTTVEQVGESLILTGPDSKTMEFVPDAADPAPACTTCPPPEE